MTDGDKAPKGGWKMIRDSAHVMVVHFKDGNARTMYSWDWKHRYAPYDVEEGLNYYEKKLAEYGNKADVAEVKVHLGNKKKGPLVRQYFEGRRLPLDGDS